MIGVYLSLLLGMFSTWFFFLVHEEKMESVFIWARRIIPPITVAIMVTACIA
jgi:hypothetical protein